MRLALDIGLAGLALGIERVEFEIEIVLGRFAGVDRAAEGQSQTLRPPPRPFVGVPPRIANFTGRGVELDRLDVILMREKRAAVTEVIGRVAIQGMGGLGKFGDTGPIIIRVSGGLPDLCR
jgi:hypothetical protein